MSTITRSRLWSTPIVAAGILVVGVAGVWAWRTWFDLSQPLVSSGHVAGLWGVCLSLWIWLARHAYQECDRLNTSRPMIRGVELICLATCLYAVLVNFYFIVAQFGLAIIHTWSHTVLVSSPWIFSSVSVLGDLACVAIVCLVMTHVTRSTYFLVPLFWVMILALLWQCLLIPPVLPEPNSWAAELTGIPSFWVVILMIMTAILLCGFIALQGWGWKRSRVRALAVDVRYLTRPARSWPGMDASVGVVAVAVLLLGILLLVFPSPARGFQQKLPGLGCALAAGTAAVGVFVVNHRHFRESLAETAFGLMTLAICSACLVFVPAEPAALADRFPLILNALIIGCAIASALWLWLAGVWHQQLDDGVAWTTAGRLIPTARRSSFMAAAFGVLLAWQMAIWPLREQARLEDYTAARMVWGCSAIVLVGISLLWATIRTRKPPFRVLLLVNCFLLALFIFVRILPYTDYPRWGR